MKETDNEIDVLDKFNISAFCDEWGPEKVIQVYDSQTGMIGILIIDNTAKGPGKGGIRIAENLTPYEIFRLDRFQRGDNRNFKQEGRIPKISIT